MSLRQKASSKTDLHSVDTLSRDPQPEEDGAPTTSVSPSRATELPKPRPPGLSHAIDGALDAEHLFRSVGAGLGAPVLSIARRRLAVDDFTLEEVTLKISSFEVPTVHT